MVTAVLPKAEQELLDGLRSRYFPPERNYLAAHLTLLHAVPDTARHELFLLLDELSQKLPLAARLVELRSLGRGFCVAIDAPDLIALHRRLIGALQAELGAQDRQGLWPHVTLQNKVPAALAKQDLAEARSLFQPRDAHIEALAVWRYLGGPWQHMRTFRPAGALS